MAAWVGGAAVVILFLGIAIYAGFRLTESIEDGLEVRGRSLANGLAVHAIEPVLTDDSFMLFRLLRDHAAGEPDVSYAFVRGKDGHILAHTFEQGFPKELGELLAGPQTGFTHFRTKDGPMLDVCVPLAIGQSPEVQVELGDVHVGISRARAVAEQRRLVLTLAAFLIPALLVVMYVSRQIGLLVSKPLKRLAMAAHQVPGGGTLPEQIPLSGTAEVRELSQAFRDMVFELRRLETQQEEARKRMVSAERLAALGELAAGLAHEIINPLDGVIECSRLLETETDRSQRLKKYLPLIRSGLSRIDRVMRQMLTFARRSTRQTLGEHDAMELMRNTIGLAEGRLAKRGIEFSWQCDGIGSCICDKESVEQAILNLVLNAADAVSGIDRAAVRISSQCDRHWVQVYVDDNGPGVPADMHERVFVPFFTTKGAGKGTGLGLTVSRQAMRQCGGDLVLDSRPSPLGGARFTIILPKIQTEEQEDEP
ncbi:MAG: HAMP domain-containing sensor histidine kinase [Planctomycetia bacterium]|nr:HAMP domain-containing sensor histidine kinase [Planctomycetia bacterium]